MALIWDAFLEDYDYEVFFKWDLRDTLEIFWHYCQDGDTSVAELIAGKAIKKKEETDD